MSKTKTNYGALSVIITVFFFWGFFAAGNNILIPFCKEYFRLDQFQSQLVDLAFYFAYYLGALILFIIGSTSGSDPVRKWGYKKSIVYGLLVSVIGATAIIISVHYTTFTGILFGLFIVALGFSLQQTAAYPFIISLGDESTGSNRSSLGGGVNSLGTTIGPLVVSLALFGSAAVTINAQSVRSLTLDKVSILYICIGILFIGISALFAFSKKLPNTVSIEKTEKANKALGTLLIVTGLLIACFAPVFNSYKTPEAKQVVQLEKQLEQAEDNKAAALVIHELKEEIQVLKRPLDNTRMLWLSCGLVVILGGLSTSFVLSKKKKEGWGAMQYPQLILGMLAIFMYVGVEVAIGSNLGELLKQKAFGGLSVAQIAPYTAMFWGSLMVGRWAGAIHAFEMSDRLKTILTTVIPLVAFGIVLGLTALAGHDVQPLYGYIVCVLIQIIGFYLGQNKPAKTLLIFSILGVIATIIGLTNTGTVSIYAFLSAGLFCSIMWPCIFSLSIAGLGKYKAQGSAFLIMMILGGAIIPPLQGKLSDITGIQNSFIVGTICFVYLGVFAFWVRNILKKQGVSLD